MTDYRDKICIITGAGSGIGAALAAAFAAEGARLALTDIDGDGAETVAAGLRAMGAEAIALACDVADPASVRAAAAAVDAAYGRADIVCSNAGVAKNGQLDLDDWRWIMDVNLTGSLNMIDAFLPMIRRHGEGGHILLTASISSFLSGAGVEAYSASKHALLALGEGLAEQLAPESIGVSLLCPAFVRTGIHHSERQRPDRYGDSVRIEMDDDHPLAQGVMNGVDPLIIAERAIEGMKAGECHIFTHPNTRPAFEAYHARIMAAFDAAESSPALARVESWPALV